MGIKRKLKRKTIFAKDPVTTKKSSSPEVLVFIFFYEIILYLVSFLPYFKKTAEHEKRTTTPIKITTAPTATAIPLKIHPTPPTLPVKVPSTTQITPVKIPSTPVKQSVVEIFNLSKTINLVAKNELEMLTESQKNAIELCIIHSENRSNESLKNLVETNKFTIEKLNIIQKYLWEDAPVIIHFPIESILENLYHDSYYRNQFETNTSKGILDHYERRKWENNLFGYAYDKSSGFERVKYGTLNLTNNPNGVPSASNYGNSYFKLKNKVKARTTFTYKDSGYLDISKIHTFQNMINYVEMLSCSDTYLLNDIFGIIEGRAKFTKLFYLNYTEIQIHGPIKLDRDIECLYVNKIYENDSKIVNLLHKFKEKHGIPFYWIM